VAGKLRLDGGSVDLRETLPYAGDSGNGDGSLQCGSKVLRRHRFVVGASSVDHHVPHVTPSTPSSNGKG
jgi:hypothetical protein